MKSLPLMKINIKGGAFERGLQYGKILKAEINKFLNTDLAHINLVRKKPLRKEEALKIIEPYITIIEEDIPNIAEEIKGMAIGANITYQEAMLLQLRRELIGSGLECSSIAFFDENAHAVIAQNIDLPGHLTDYGILIHATLAENDDLKLLQYSHIGLLGYIGFNNKGIAIGINMVLAEGWRPGVPPYLLVRHLLHQSDLSSCLREIKRIRRASSRSFFLTDGMRILNVEMTVDDQRILEDRILLHTNHYLHKDFQCLDRIDRQACTFHRLDSLKQFVNVHNQQLNFHNVKNILSNHDNAPFSICCHNSQNTRSAQTIASVFLYPKKRSILVAKGFPCQSRYHHYLIH